MNDDSGPRIWHGTTILSVRRGDQVVIAGDGQVSLGATVIKSNARKVRRLGDGSILAGFAGATADAFTLFERLEAKLEKHPGQLAHDPRRPAAHELGRVRVPLVGHHRGAGRVGVRRAQPAERRVRPPDDLLGEPR